MCIKDKGGLKLVDLRMKEKSHRISLVFIYLQFEEIKILADYCFSNVVGKVIWRYNINTEDIKVIYKDHFWRDVLEAWSMLTYHNPKNIRQIQQQVIWGNSIIRMDGKPVFNCRAIRNGLLCFKQLLNEDLTFKSFTEVNREFPKVMTYIDNTVYAIWYHFTGLEY